MHLCEYDIQYVTQKSIKGSVLSEYLAHQPLDDYHPMKFNFPGEDVMFVKDYEISSPTKDLNQELVGRPRSTVCQMRWGMESGQC